MDIVDVVSSYVPLQKSGQRFKALCPFHTEKTPSFVVSPERQSWRCFGACATGGDAFAFVMRQENIEFSEAMRLLAQKAGIELSPQSQQQRDQNAALLTANRLAADFYHEKLKSPEGAAALQYLRRRGVDDAAIQAFQLGYSPNRWDGLRNYFASIDLPAADAVASGLIHRNDNGRTWDFFRDRLMFPIHDRKGDVIGFGGRQMDDAQPNPEVYNPKYINTASTPVFDKRSVLYGLHLAHSSIRDANTGIVVEGYMDVIAAHQHGYRNVVASMGTTLTENQVALLKSLANKFVLALDPDTAGQEATLRSLEASWKVIGEQSTTRRSLGVLHRRDNITLNIATLPQGKDPDELIRHDAAEWERLTQNAQPLMSYIIPAIAARFDITTGQGKSQVVDAVFPLIAATQNPFDQQRYTQDLANALGITLDELKAGLPRRTRRQRAQPPRPAAPRSEPDATAFTGNRDDVRENYLLTLLLNRPQLRERITHFSPECFRNSANREVFNRWMACTAIDDLEASIDEPLNAHLQSLASKPLVPMDTIESEWALDECIRILEYRHLVEQEQELLSTDDAATPPARELAPQVAQLNARIRATEARQHHRRHTP